MDHFNHHGDRHDLCIYPPPDLTKPLTSSYDFHYFCVLHYCVHGDHGSSIETDFLSRYFETTY
jgi:hypothetical protein